MYLYFMHASSNVQDEPEHLGKRAEPNSPFFRFNIECVDLGPSLLYFVYETTDWIATKAQSIYSAF